MVGRGFVVGVLLATGCASACSSERPAVSDNERVYEERAPAKEERPASPGGSSPAPQVEEDDDGDDDANNAYFVFAKDKDVGVVLTADNSYAFGWGDRDVLKNFRSRPITRVAADIFNCPTKLPDVECSEAYCGPEAYVVPEAEAPEGAYLYVVAWSDFAVTQGLIGQFRRGEAPPLFTGGAGWEVCATGEPRDEAPSQVEVNAKIALCNAGDPGVSSRGWVNAAGPVTPGALGTVVIGESNKSQRGNFPIACRPTTTTPGIEGAARWMWYAPPGFTSDRAFRDNNGNATHTYLVFRVLASNVPVILK